MKTFLAATSLAALLASPLLAQTSTAPGTTTAPSTTSPSTPSGSTASSSSGGMQMSGPGMTTAQTSTVAVQFLTVKATDATVSRLLGTDVYNTQNENLGEIEDFVITDGKTITGVILSVGGFLGVGERYVAVQPANIMLARADNNTFRATLNTTKDNLKNAPTFDYSKTRR